MGKSDKTTSWRRTTQNICLLGTNALSPFLLLIALYEICNSVLLLKVEELIKALLKIQQNCLWNLFSIPKTLWVQTSDNWISIPVLSDDFFHSIFRHEYRSLIGSHTIGLTCVKCTTAHYEPNPVIFSELTVNTTVRMQKDGSQKYRGCVGYVAQ